MRYEVVKLDKRFAYYGSFRYMLEFSKSSLYGTGVLEFDRARRWFNQTYDYTQDIETRAEMIKTKTRIHDDDWSDINRNWSYSIRYQEYRIYMTEPVLTMFKLKWGNGDSFTD